MGQFKSAIRSSSQVTRYRSTRSNLCRDIWGSILICVAESCAVHETKRLCVVQKSIKDWLGVKYYDLVEFTVLRLE